MEKNKLLVVIKYLQKEALAPQPNLRRYSSCTRGWCAFISGGEELVSRILMWKNNLRTCKRCWSAPKCVGTLKQMLIVSVI